MGSSAKLRKFNCKIIQTNEGIYLTFSLKSGLTNSSDEMEF